MSDDNAIRCERCDAPMIPGPQGGSAQNYYCSNRSGCGAAKNIAMYRGEIIFEHDIMRPDNELFDMYAVKSHKE